MGNSPFSPASSYRLDQLGWLQFERVCSLVLKADAGLGDLGWLGHADTGRVALVEEPVAVRGIRLAGPVTVAVVWVRDDESVTRRLSALVERFSALPSDLGFWCEDRVLVLTNLDGVAAQTALQQVPLLEHRRVVVLGNPELSESLDRHAGLRAAIPSVLGLRDLAPLIAANVRARSSLDVERAQALARVFWPTRAYERARDVLALHRFVVLTGPPEMGKTAIAQMLALAQLTDGWEAHECNSPEQLWRVFDRKQRQVFVVLFRLVAQLVTGSGGTHRAAPAESSGDIIPSAGFTSPGWPAGSPVSGSESKTQSGSQYGTSSTGCSAGPSAPGST